MKNQTMRDPSIKEQDAFRVLFNDRLCSPCFRSIGAAQAYLDLLERGDREPEYSAKTE